MMCCRCRKHIAVINERALGTGALVCRGNAMTSDQMQSNARSIDSLSEKEARHRPNYCQGDDPSNDGLSEDPPVDACGTLKRSDAHCCPDLTVRC
mmetsp:Transcript_45677/g.73451  ORF Transcript_45677/g.73451 Transcript_45677/m.73451 type:complete len:95 (-) Transcript_45677:1162-1446(-)